MSRNNHKMSPISTSVRLFKGEIRFLKSYGKPLDIEIVFFFWVGEATAAISKLLFKNEFWQKLNYELII